jgi:phenylacetate-CoA ligase
MIVVRGVNVYPSAVDEIVRGLAGIAEYRVRVLNAAALAELVVEIEPQPGHDGKTLAATLERRFSAALALRVPVQAVAAGALPRFEMKARRWVRE